MDTKTKGMVMSGMLVLSILLGILAVTGMSWVTADEEGVEANYGLSEGELTMDLFGTKTTLEVEWGDACDDAKDMDMEDDDSCDVATAGTIGTIGLWLGIVMAAVFAAMLILPMAGVDAMENMPDLAQKIISWGAGGVMLLGIIGWMIMMPELESEMGYGMSFFMAMFAGLLALGTQLMDIFVPADE